MAGISVETADNLIVSIIGDNGNIGWGEASSAPTMTGEFVQGMVAAAQFVNHQWLAKLFQICRI